jgi:hypothetical protein
VQEGLLPSNTIISTQTNIEPASSCVSFTASGSPATQSVSSGGAYMLDDGVSISLSSGSPSSMVTVQADTSQVGACPSNMPIGSSGLCESAAMAASDVPAFAATAQSLSSVPFGRSGTVFMSVIQASCPNPLASTATTIVQGSF